MAHQLYLVCEGNLWLSDPTQRSQETHGGLFPCPGTNLAHNYLVQHQMIVSSIHKQKLSWFWRRRAQCFWRHLLVYIDSSFIYLTWCPYNHRHHHDHHPPSGNPTSVRKAVPGPIPTGAITNMDALTRRRTGSPFIFPPGLTCWWTVS